MRVPLALPELLVDEGARRLALAYLADAATARVRMAGAADPEALHDYRVAMRRLRSCVRAYRQVESRLGSRPRRWLRRLARGTNRTRDLDVHLAWLDRRLAEGGAAERPGTEWLARRMRAARARSAADMVALDGRLFARLARRLERRLTRFRACLEPDATSTRRTTAVVSASLVGRAADRLRQRVAAVARYGDFEALHRARIEAKRLRYLLEPFATFLPECEPIIARLRELQTGLGEVHDAQVFDAEVRRMLAETGAMASVVAAPLPALEALRSARKAAGRQAFERIRPDWLGRSAGPFFASVARLAEALNRLPQREREVERKFLLRRLPSLPPGARVLDIEQGYLPGERLIERLRRVRSEAGVELVRTLKAGSGVTRLESEEPVAPELFERLWPLTASRRVRKRRHRIVDGELTWEIDQFLDRDLVLAEVELGGRLAEVTLPAWLAPHLDREVTEDEAYGNFRLALSGTG